MMRQWRGDAADQAMVRGTRCGGDDMLVVMQIGQAMGKAKVRCSTDALDVKMDTRGHCLIFPRERWEMMPS